MESKFLEWLFAQGPSIVILVTVLWIGFKQFKANAARQIIELQKAWDAKEKASEDRFNDMKERFNASDRRHEECEKQKDRQQAQLFQIALMTGNVKSLDLPPLHDENSPNHIH